MLILFTEILKKKRYLALFKMDPSKSDIITASEDHSGQITLNLSVKHIKEALPDPGSRILKWALIPHPISDKFDAKVKDKEGKPHDHAQSLYTSKPGWAI